MLRQEKPSNHQTPPPTPVWVNPNRRGNEQTLLRIWESSGRRSSVRFLLGKKKKKLSAVQVQWPHTVNQRAHLEYLQTGQWKKCSRRERGRYSSVNNVTKSLFSVHKRAALVQIPSSFTSITALLFSYHGRFLDFFIFFSARMRLTCSCVQRKAESRTAHNCYKQLVEKRFPGQAEPRLRYFAAFETSCDCN